MIRAFHIAALACIAFIQPTYAADGQFDRNAEVAEIAALLRKATRDEASAICERIYYSGISDTQLAAIVNERLARDAPTLSLENRRGHMYIDDQYGRWMAQALSSFGREEYRATLEKIAKDPDEGGTELRRVRRTAASAARRIEWHAKKNAIMASLNNHRPGDQEHVSRLVNLLKSEDPTLQEFAMDRIRAGRLEDARLYATMSELLAGFVASPAIVDNGAVGTNVRLIKMLAATGDLAYIPLMEKVASTKSDPRIQRHAQAAILRLTRNTTATEDDETPDSDEGE